MFHFKSLSVSFIFLFVSFCSLEVSGQSDNRNVINEEKLSLSFGLGHEYSLMGFRLNYSISDDLALTAGFSPFAMAVHGQLGHSFAKAGIEHKFSKLSSNERLVPYLNVLFGVGDHLNMTDGGIVLRNEILDDSYFNKTFFGATVGIGTKFKLFKKGRSYGNLGFQYVVVDTNSRDRYINEKRLDILRRNYNIKTYSFSLGYTFVIKSKKPAAKN